MKYLLIILLSASFGLQAKPVESIGSHQKQLKKCLKQSTKEHRCLGDLIYKYLPADTPSNVEQVKKLEAFLVDWLGKESVSNVYSVRNEDKGGFVALRDLIVEDSAGNYMLVELVYLRTLGDWYVFNFNVNSQFDQIREKVGF